MLRFSSLLVALVVITSPTLLGAEPELAAESELAAEPDSADLAFYQSDVLPLLKRHCFECHSHEAGEANGGLMLDSRASFLTGGDSGPALQPGNVEASLLIQSIRYDESSELEMPPDGKLTDAEIEVLVQWVTRGAPAPASAAPVDKSDKDRKAEEHWAFQPLRADALPETVQAGSESIDHWVQQSRQSAGVVPVARADKRTIVQRLYSDLLGVPVDPAELDRLTAEGSLPIEAIVDQLMKKPEFGERWGRHWLDVARYADSNGCSIESNNTHDNAWRFRDYVIASFNEDKPYDQFVAEQVAGDLLDAVSDTQRSDQLIATGFLLLGPKAFGTGFDQLRMDVIDEQIDTLGKAMLGMSLGCARCHDHKFDPIPTADYYALAGIFSSTQSVSPTKGWRQGKSWNRVELPVLASQESAALKQAYQQTQKDAEGGTLVKQAEERQENAEKKLETLRKESPDDAGAIEEAEQALEQAKRNLFNARNMKTVLPVISPVPVAMAVTDKDKVVDEAIRIRGEIKRTGDVVPRRMMSLLQSEIPEEYSIPAGQSGRLQLARWLVDVDQGAGRLLARVAVNRIWGHLFARPLADSTDNFGLTGSAPSHPELLDYLARRFVESGWSTKGLIRDIVLTETYRLAAVEHVSNQAIDPSNQWLWRFQPRRIDVEVLRDSLLAISGQLDRTRGGKTLQHLGLVSLGGDHILLDTPSPYQRRSIYLPIYRDTVGLTEDVDQSMAMLSTFDFSDPNLMAGSRSKTVVPTQALFLMNSPFVHEQATALAEDVLGHEAPFEERIEYLYRKIYGRSATAAEVDDLRRYLEAFADADAAEEGQDEGTSDELMAWTSLCQSLFGSNEFLFLD